MAKKVCNLNLDEDVINGLDEFAGTFGYSRSAAANLILKGVVARNPSDVITEMITAAANQKSGGNEKERDGAVSPA